MAECMELGYIVNTLLLFLQMSTSCFIDKLSGTLWYVVAKWMLIYVTHIHEVNCGFCLLKYGNPCALDQDRRMEVVEDSANSLEIRNDIRPSRYFRSGLKIVRMADEYLEEGRLEKVYILYRRFITCFKKLHHPGFASVSSDRAFNNQKLREVEPKAQKLKTHLLEQYTLEYKHCEEQQKQKSEEGTCIRKRRQK